MNYDYNRAAFRSVCTASGIHPLASAYCTCVLIELGLKEHLGLILASSNGGHDLPWLISRIGLISPKNKSTCSALQSQLQTALVKLFSQHKDGTAKSIPGRSYPHLRYLRHASDWPSQSSPDSDINDLNSLLKRIFSFLRTKIGVKL